MTTGIKVSKPTKNISSTDIRDFILHSDYPMFKIHTISSGSITINAGESTGTTTISHNLGYVPAFLVYEDNQLFPSGIDCYATTTGITITNNLGTPYNQVTYDSNQFFHYVPGGLPDVGVVAGQVLGSGYDSAVWFETINISQGQIITNATFELHNVRTTSTDDIKFRIYGIDEDDTANFDGGYPGSRPNTDAYNQKTQSANTNYFTFSDNWTSILQEIVNRTGWSSGNHMGFKIQQDGTPNNKFMFVDEYTVANSDLKLKITLPGSTTTNYKVVIFKDKIHT